LKIHGAVNDQPNGETLFNCYYSSPELTATPPYGMSSASSTNGTD